MKFSTTTRDALFDQGLVCHPATAITSWHLVQFIARLESARRPGGIARIDVTIGAAHGGQYTVVADMKTLAMAIEILT